MSFTTARTIVDSARVRHWAFSTLTIGDGAVLLFLRSRLVTHVATHGATIEGLVGTTLEYAIPVITPGFLVTLSGAVFETAYGQALQPIGVGNGGVGVPMVAQAYQDGWPVHLTDDGVPFVDFSTAPLAADPFGLYGGTPGFPLPPDMVRLTAVTLVYGPDRYIPCDIVPEAQRHTTLPGRDPACFVATNRLVPVLATASGPSRWDNVTALQISYVGVQSLRTLDDVLNLPSVLVEALIADVAEFLAMRSKEVPPADKVGLSREAARCGAAIGAAALDLLNEPLHSAVHYRG